MKTLQRFFIELGVLLVGIIVFFSFLYNKVYTENADNVPTGTILISEIMVSGGTGKANDEFIELYNPSDNPVSVGGWSVNKLTRTASSTDYQVILTLPVGLILPGKSYVLLSHLESAVSSTADYLYSGIALSDDNSVVLRNGDGQVIDLVGYGSAENSEEFPALGPTAQLPSIERKPGGQFGNAQDLNQNQLDFFRTNPNPQNRFFAPVNNTSSTLATTTPEIILASSTTEIAETEVPELVAGVASSTPVYPPIGSILITEIYPSPKSDEVEFVEIYNRTPDRILIDKWFITEGSGAKTILVGEIESMKYRVIEKPKGSLNNSGDLVSLVNPIDVIVDQVAYGDWDDGTPGNNAPGAITGYSIVRAWEENDSNLDYYDFVLSVSSTKGYANQIITPPEEGEKEGVSEVKVVQVETESSTPKTAVKKSEPLYIRVVYQATSTVGSELFFDASLTSGGVGNKHYLWEMDDGKVIRGEFVTHIYQEPDTYSVVLTAFDETGAEKHKTIKVKILPDSKVTSTQSVTVSGKSQTVKVSAAEIKKAESAPVFIQMNELFRTKTNTDVRIRGVLSAVLTNKTSFDYYLIGENSAGGALVGTIVKTKNTNIDARIGDLIEITGKYITNQTTGNYIQFGADDQLSIIQSGEVLTPVSSSLKSVHQLTGGFVQIQGKVLEKKSGYVLVGDEGAEIKITGDFDESLNTDDHIRAIGYVIKIKTGVQLKIVNSYDVVKIDTKNEPKVAEISSLNSKKHTIKASTVMVVVLVIGVVMLVMKKSLGRKKDSETEL